MTIQRVTDLKKPISEILQGAGSDGVLLEASDQQRYAVIPLDDDLIDYLIERNPKFRAACQGIREHMKSGHSKTHAEVKKLIRGLKK